MQVVTSEQITMAVCRDAESAATAVPPQATLSVIIPAFNEVPTVAEILRQVLQQPTVSEIVFVDDGSTTVRPTAQGTLCRGSLNHCQQLMGSALCCYSMKQTEAKVERSVRGWGRSLAPTC